MIIVEKLYCCLPA